MAMDALRDGTVSERKEALKNMNDKLLKTLVTIIGNVVETDTYIDDIIKPEVLSKYIRVKIEEVMSELEKRKKK